MRTTYLNMKSLIDKKFYSSAEEIMTYLELFASMNRLTAEEHAELVAMTEERYPSSEPVR